MPGRSSRFAGWRSALGALLIATSALQAGSVGVLADPASPLQVTKTANPSPVASGDQLTYTIVIKNTGGAKVDSVVMTDQVNGVGTIQSPPGLPQLTITSTQGPCSQGGPNGNVVTCQIGTIPGGGLVTITIRGQVTAANGTSLNNTASVTGTKSAQNFTTNASVSVLVQGGTGGGSLPDLTLNKTGPTSIAPTAAMTYTLTVNNVGTANTSNVKVVDTLPPGVTLQAPTPFETTSLFTCSANALNPITVTCTGGAVNQGQNATIKINAISPAATGQITNTAIVDPDNAITESNELNNASAAVNTNVTTSPPAPLLSIFKTDNNPTVYPWSTGAGPDPVNPGQVLTYKIQVTNNASGNNSRADDVVVTDGTQGLEASSIVASQVIVNGTVGNTGGCVVEAPQVRCSIRTLNSGGTLTITITGIVVSTAGANIFNTATVTGNIKNQGVSNTASESTTVRPAVDLTITKSDSPDPVCARSWPQTNPNQHLANAPDGVAPPASGDIPGIGLLQPPVCLGGLTYHFVVGNSGQSLASGVSIRDPLPAGLIFDSYQSSMPGLTCGVDASNVVTCNGGAIGPASTETIDFRLVAPPTLGLITNSVTVDPNNAIFEPDETNNDATTTTDVRTGIDLVVWKGDKGPATPPADDPPGGAPSLTEGFDNIATAGTGTYTIIVDNVGTQDSTGIKVVDTLPAGTKFLSVTSDQGFTCAHDGSATGGNVTCIGGHLLGTEAEFYQAPGTPPPPAPGDEWATIKIKFFATQFVQPAMHNIVRVDPDNTIDEVNELNNLASDDTVVTTGNDNIGAFNQLTVDKTQVSPAGAVATNGTLIYNLHVSNLGTDPVSNVVVQDYLPAGSRFISATDITVAGPASAKFFCSHDGSPTGGTITCTGGDFSGSVNVIPGPPVVPIARDIRVTIFAPNTPQTASNVTTVDPANLVPEGNEFDNDDQQDTTVAPCTSLVNCTATNAFYELTIDKTQVTPPDPAARNGIVTYDLKVENLGSDSVSGVTVTDRLPAGFTFISARDSSNGDPEAFTCTGPDASGVVTCSGGSLSGTVNALPSGAPTVRHIRIRVFAPDTPGEYVNLAFVDPSNTVPEGNEFNNQDSQITNVTNGGNGPFIDLNVVKTQEVLPGQDMGGSDPTLVRVTPGGPIKYVLEVKNLATGPDSGTAFNVTVRDVLPANVTFFSAADEAAGPGNFTCGQVPGQPNTIDCTGGTLPAGSSRKIDIFVVAPSNLDRIATNQADIQQTLTNSAFVDPDNAIPEGDETNNVSVLKTIVQSKINLTVVSKEGPDQAQQNQEADYVITVKNEKVWGDGAIAVDAHVFDYLPVGLIPLSVATDTSNMTCQTFENPVNFIDCVGDMEPDQTVVITVHVFITAESGAMDNEACIDPDHLIDETNELDNCKTKTTNVGVTPTPTPTPAPNLIINKSASTSVVTPGQAFSYTITVSNVGTATAPNPVTMTDPLPSAANAAVTYVSATATNGFTCSESSGTVTCTSPAGGLPAGQATVITIQVTVNSDTTLPITNTATATEGSETESDSVTTNVGNAAVDLVLASVDDAPDPVSAGGVITYTIVAANAGTSDANGLDIAQTFADTSGLTLVSATGSQGFTCSYSDPVVTCSGNLLAGQSVVLTVKMDTTALAVPSVFSTIEVDSTGEFSEADEINNLDFEVTTVDADLCQNCYDLVMGPIFVNPDPVANGDPVTWNFDVTNIGDLPTSADPDLAADPVEIQINIDGAFNEYTGLTSGTVILPGFSCTVTSHAGDLGNNDPEILCTKTALAAGEGVIGSVTVNANTSADPSVLFFDVVVDPANKVAGEFLETNNTGSMPATVDTPPPG